MLFKESKKREREKKHKKAQQQQQQKKREEVSTNFIHCCVYFRKFESKLEIIFFFQRHLNLHQAHFLF